MSELAADAMCVHTSGIAHTKAMADTVLHHVQEVTARELENAHPRAAPMSELDSHVAWHRQLATNTRDMSLLHIEFNIATWGHVAEAWQVAKMAQLGGARLMPCIWCGALRA